LSLRCPTRRAGQLDLLEVLVWGLTHGYDLSMPLLTFTKEDVHHHLYDEQHGLIWEMTRLAVDEGDKRDRRLVAARVRDIEQIIRDLGLTRYDPQRYMEAEDAYNAEVEAQWRSLYEP
jgi:hypothetical protein